MDTIVLSKKVHMCSNPRWVEVSIGFSISVGLKQGHEGEKLYFRGIFCVSIRLSSSTLRLGYL